MNGIFTMQTFGGMVKSCEGEERRLKVTGIAVQ
jgi:hypothetical protein